MATIRLPFSPSEGLRRSLAAAATSPPRRPPLVGFCALQSVMCSEVSGCLGYLIPPRRSSFPSRSRVTAGPAKPGTSHGLPSLFATPTCGVHARGHPKPASFRPRRFSRPRRLPPPPALRVCFTPLPRPGFTLQGFSLARSRTGSSPALALLSFAPHPCPQFDPTAPGYSARLQGFAPLANPSRPVVV